MTEDEARQVLHDFFARCLQPGQSIWIGQGKAHGDLGYSFRAGTYYQEDGLPDNFPVWAVDAATKTAELMLLQHAD